MTTKTGLVALLKEYYEDKPISAFSTMATSYILPGSLDNDEFKQFRRRISEHTKGFCEAEEVPYKHCHGNLWLVKPDGLNQG